MVAVALLSGALWAAAAAAQQVCCPSGCVQNGGACVTTGPNPRSCNLVPCSSPSGQPGGVPGSTPGSVVVLPPPAVGYCNVEVRLTPAQVQSRTDQCVGNLVGAAQLFGCLFEDDAGRSEDKRTGLTCPERQKALARQCRARCENFVRAAATQRCMEPNDVWKQSFGDIGGEVVGSARVAECGPRLRTKARVDIRDVQKMEKATSHK